MTLQIIATSTRLGSTRIQRYSSRSRFKPLPSEHPKSAASYLGGSNSRLKMISDFMDPPHSPWLQSQTPSETGDHSIGPLLQEEILEVDIRPSPTISEIEEMLGWALEENNEDESKNCNSNTFQTSPKSEGYQTSRTEKNSNTGTEGLNFIDFEIAVNEEVENFSKIVKQEENTLNDHFEFVEGSAGEFQDSNVSLNSQFAYQQSIKDFRNFRNGFNTLPEKISYINHVWDRVQKANLVEKSILDTKQNLEAIIDNCLYHTYMFTKHESITPNLNLSNKKKSRQHFTKEIKQHLQLVFDENEHPTSETIENLANHINCSKSKLRTWFKSKRANKRKSKQKTNITRLNQFLDTQVSSSETNGYKFNDLQFGKTYQYEIPRR